LEVWWRVAALRFFFVRTLKPREFREKLPYPNGQSSADLTIRSTLTFPNAGKRHIGAGWLVKPREWRRIDTIEVTAAWNGFGGRSCLGGVKTDLLVGS
jgi:hypothetical protein